MRALIIGCGYIGEMLASSLHEKGVQVFCNATDEQSTLKKKQLPFIKDVLLFRGDEKEKVHKAVEGKDIVCVMVAPRDQQDYENVYLKTAQSLSQAPHKPYLIYLSSTSVFGEQNGAPVDENTPLTPSQPNQKILIEAEKTLLERGNSLIFRLGEIVGPKREIYRRLEKAPEIKTQKERICNFSFAEDTIHAILFAIEKKLQGIYHLVHPFHPKRGDLYEASKKKHHLQLPLIIESNAPTKHGGNKTVLSEKITLKGFSFQTIETLDTIPHL